MEFQNLQKGFFEQADSNSADDRSVFIRKTYSLLLLEYFIVGGISLLFFQLVFWVRLWVFVIIMIICQLCHFYFEMSQIGDQDQQKKILNYIFCTVHLICLTFTFFFLWNLFTEQYFGYIWIAYFQLGVVILLLNFYTNQTITHFEYSASWIIALVTPITIEFILNFFLEIDYYSQQQTYITMIITWYSCFMLQISQNFNIQIDYSFDSILIASCKLLGAQYQVIVMLIKFFINRINNQNNLVMTDQNEKLEYFKQVTITFTSIIMVIFLYIRYGYGFMIEFSWEYFNNQIDYIQLTTVRFLPIFGIAYHLAQFLIFCTEKLILQKYYLLKIIKWALFLVQNVFNFIFLMGISNYLAYNNQYIYDYYYNYDYYENFNYLLQRDYFLQIAFCMFAGLGIGLQSYSLMNREDIDYKKAFLFGIINPFLIFISQIYYAYYAEFEGVSVAYIFAILVVFTVYLCLILFELHQQINSDKIDFDTKEYYLGAMVIFQPIKSIIIRVISFFI